MGPATNLVPANKRRARTELESLKRSLLSDSSEFHRTCRMRYRQMRFAAAGFSLILLVLGASSEVARREEPRIVEKVTPLPVALDKDCEFRKTKLFLISVNPSTAGQRTQKTTSTLGAKSTSPNQKTA